MRNDCGRIAQIVRSIASDVCINTMNHSGYMARVMAAPKLPDNGSVHGLPPGQTIPAIPIHCLPGCPESWVREAGSYVVMVEEQFGLWFDWTMNDEYATAVVPSVKGMNPITGQKLEGCQLEQYRDRCPVHDVPFAHGNYCEKCDYKWPYQNYVAYSNKLWWDGWKQPDGTVRQFFYTSDIERDIASLAIGKENTMPAFGFAFFKHKHERPKTQWITRSLYAGSCGMPKKKYGSSKGYSPGYGSSTDFSYKVTDTTGTLDIDCTTNTKCFHENMAYSENSENLVRLSESARSIVSSTPAAKDAVILDIASPAGDVMAFAADDVKAFVSDESRSSAPVKEVSIGAGAAIDQKLVIDTRPLSDYHEKPQSLIRIYFVFEPQLREIVANGGIKKIDGEKKGFLKGMPVGN